MKLEDKRKRHRCKDFFFTRSTINKENGMKRMEIDNNNKKSNRILRKTVVITTTTIKGIRAKKR